MTNTSYRQSICDYLGELPLLDRQVLFQRYAQKAAIKTIASNLQITASHVEHIIRRTDEFRHDIANRAPVHTMPASSWKVTSVTRRQPEAVIRHMHRPDLRQHAA